MGIVKVFACVAAAVLAVSEARAADMPEIVQQPALALQQLGSTWYLRGDIAYRFSTPASSDWDGLAISDPNLGGVLAGGGGFGVKMGWLRVDATIDYGFSAPFNGTAPGVTTFTGGIDSLVLLANVYADLGTWYAFTPYIGGGVGTAGVRTTINNALLAPAAGIAGVERWNFAWAVMAGFGYNVTPSLMIDLGYRYLHLGDAATGFDQSGPGLTVRAISANEVRLGVRYTIE